MVESMVILKFAFSARSLIVSHILHIWHSELSGGDICADDICLDVKDA